MSTSISFALQAFLGYPKSFWLIVAVWIVLLTPLAIVGFVRFRWLYRGLQAPTYPRGYASAHVARFTFYCWLVVCLVLLVVFVAARQTLGWEGILLALLAAWRAVVDFKRWRESKSAPPASQSELISPAPKNG